jgi:hypothetical protein
MFVLFELYFSVHFLCTLFAIKFLFTDKKKKKKTYLILQLLSSFFGEFLCILPVYLGFFQSLMQ